MQVNRAGTAALLLTPLMAAGACSGATPVDRPVAGVQITPAGGSVRPDSPIAVKAVNGSLQNVTVVRAGARVEGAIGKDGSWRARWPLDPGARYEVTATAFGTDGETQTTVGAFQTTKPRNVSGSTVVLPDNKETVGVGMPVKLQFEQKIDNKAGVERALEVRTSTPVEGAWRWFDDQTVIFRPKTYWPAHTRVQVLGHTAGVRLSKNTYGSKNINLSFKIGDRHESVGSARTHHMVVLKNGKKVRDIPTSMGMGGSRKYTTTNGVHLAIEKEYMTVMTSPGIGPGSAGYYQENVYWTVKISDSGEYVHGAPWSVGSQGYSNVSHGCVNISTGNARWFHNFSYRGDPIRIRGTSRELEPENGWGYWQLDWKNWLKGSEAKSVTSSTLTGGAFAAVPPPAPKAVKDPATGPARPPASPDPKDTVKS
ncbi:MAG: Ig-like domain-containing protein [Streptosporangiaceae bacterium]